MLNVVYFDGRQAAGRPAQLERVADQLIVVMGNVRLPYELSQVQWPEPTGKHVRLMDLPDGASLQCMDASAFDQWSAQNGYRTHWVAHWPTRLRWVLVSMISMVALVTVMVLWGIPWLAVKSVPFIPAWVDAKVGEAALATLDEQWLKPSTLPEADQVALRERFNQLIGSQKGQSLPGYALYFRGKGMGANAFALPGGNMVLTDELVQLVGGDERVLVGVLAHELGHVHYRHGMQSVVHVSALGVLAGVFLGDFSTLMAGVPVALGRAGYSRQAERQADAYSAQMLRNASISPAVMNVLFEKLAQRHTAKSENPQTELEKGADALVKSIPIAFASHPADAERMAYFRAQAAQCSTCR